jgi:hypothetical protein
MFLRMNRSKRSTLTHTQSSALSIESGPLSSASTSAVMPTIRNVHAAALAQALS